MSIAKNYRKISGQIPDNVQLTVVSKNHAPEEIREVYDLGQRIFGENRVQELLNKKNLLPDDIKWRLIGHLQTNKVRQIIDFVDVIESVDSERLLKEIQKEAKKIDKTVKILFEVKIAEEATKYGMDKETAEILTRKISQYPNVELIGLMGMASLTADKKQIEREFTDLKNLFDKLCQIHKMETLSMGMSGDFPIAVACGATAVRIGSAIFK